jgi:hypothetical protein
MLQENFTTMKKISSCQIQCEKALALIDKMIENQEVDRFCNSSGDLFAYEINADIHFDWVYENENDYYTLEEQEIASKLQDELQANNIQSIIHFI